MPKPSRAIPFVVSIVFSISGALCPAAHGAENSRLKLNARDLQNKVEANEQSYTAAVFSVTQALESVLDREELSSEEFIALAEEAWAFIEPLQDFKKRSDEIYFADERLALMRQLRASPTAREFGREVESLLVSHDDPFGSSNKFAENATVQSFHERMPPVSAWVLHPPVVFFSRLWQHSLSFSLNEEELRRIEALMDRATQESPHAQIHFPELLSSQLHNLKSKEWGSLAIPIFNEKSWRVQCQRILGRKKF